MNLRSSDLQHANLSGANLRSSDLQDANLGGANLNDTAIATLRGIVASVPTVTKGVQDIGELVAQLQNLVQQL